MEYLTSENLCIYIYSTVRIQDSERSLLLVSGKLSYVITYLLKLTLSIITLWTFHSICHLIMWRKSDSLCQQVIWIEKAISLLYMIFHTNIHLKQMWTSPESKGVPKRDSDYPSTYKFSSASRKINNRGSGRQELLLFSGYFKKYYWSYITGNVFVLS